MALWLVRAGGRGEQERLALEQGVAPVGWEDLPDLSGVHDRAELAGLLVRTYPEEKPKTLSNWESQLWPFLRVIAEGDLIALPLKSRAAIAIGRVIGAYRYRTDFPDTRHTRPVQWLTERPRGGFDRDLLYSLGAFMTVCRIQRNRAEERVRAMIEGRPVPPPAAVAEDEAREGGAELGVALDLERYAREQIGDYILRKFKGHRLASLVAAVLAAQGYQVREAPEGADGGVDIIAGRGPLGFERPRLAVQVKSSEAPVDVKVVRELQGAMKTFGADQGLFVAWGGYRGSVLKEAARMFFEIRLWNDDDLVRAVQEHYGRLPETIRAELPLKPVWTLVPDAG